MDKREENILCNLVYYTTIVLMLVLVVYFAYNLVRVDIRMWERVAYYIVTGLLVVNVVIDIMATMTGKYKYLSGMMLYILTIAMIVINIIVYVLDSADGVILGEFLNIDMFLMFMSLAINVLAIIIFSVGKKLVLIDRD